MYRNKLLSSIWAASWVFGILGQATAIAQEQADDYIYVLEEVLVVARKREENPRDVPISLTVIDSSLIEQQTATALKDVLGNIPNASLDVVGNSFSSWGMRGIVSQTRNAGQESGLGVYVDRVYLGRPAGFNVPLSDISQIEVLRGPQGSLFGRNTIAGALNITTQRPDENIGGYLQGSFGNFSRRDLQAGISGPISDDVLSAKLSVFSFQRDGYVDNIFFNGADLQSDDRIGGRGAFYWTPTDELEFTLSADYMEQDNTLLAGITLEPQLNNFVPGWYLPETNKVNQNDPGYDQIETGGVSIVVDWNLSEEMVFTSITSFRYTDVETLVDDDSGPITLTWSNFMDDSDTFTQEFLFHNAVSDKMDYVLGFYYLDLDVSSDRVTGLFMPYPNGTLAITSDSVVETESWAIFGSADYELTESLNLSVGLRYTDEEKSSQFTQTENGGLGFPNVSFDSSINDDAFSGDISLTWSMSDSTNLYGSIRKGFKSGGFQTDIINFSTEELFVFDPEEAVSYELGLKGIYLDRRLTVDLAVFRTDYDDMQVGQLVGLGFTTTNAGQSEISGLEFQLGFQATDTLKFGLTAGLLDTEYSKFDNCSGPDTTCAGNSLQYAPDSTASVDAAYIFPFSNGSALDFYLSANYRDSYFLTPVNDPQLKISERTLVDGKITFTTTNGDWALSLWGRNLGDKSWDVTRWKYPVTVVAFGAFDPSITGLQHTPAEPRTYGVEVIYRF